MKKINFKTLLYDNRVLWLLSLVCAVVVWLLVIDAENPNTEKTIFDVPVAVELTGTVLEEKELGVFLSEMPTVQVRVQGERYIVGSLKPGDIKVEAVLSNVTGAGVWELRLEAEAADGKKFNVLAVEPATISVLFDRTVTRKIKVTPDISGVAVPDGYILQEEYTLPGEVSVTGPETEVLSIQRCVARVDLGSTLTDSATVTTGIELFDAADEPVDMEFISVNTSVVEVVVPVLKLRQMPLSIEFLNVPANFDLGELKYTLSADTIEVAGPVRSIDVEESLSIGYIDLSGLDPTQVYEFDILLPTGFISMDDITKITVEFEHENITSQSFTVSNILITGMPAGLSASVITRSIPGVLVYGSYEALEALSAGDIVAEVDLLSREMSDEGQFRVPVRIVIATEGLAWASGTYQVQVSLQQQ